MAKHQKVTNGPGKMDLMLALFDHVPCGTNRTAIFTTQSMTSLNAQDRTVTVFAVTRCVDGTWKIECQDTKTNEFISISSYTLRKRTGKALVRDDHTGAEIMNSL